jgi:DNA-directed RNA polymerase specialized sigma24 family protein
MGLSHEQILDPATAALIRRKARRIVKRCRLSRSDYRDLQQELYLKLVRRAPLYEGRRSDPRVFIAIVLRSGASNLIKRHFAQRRDGGGLRAAR